MARKKKHPGHVNHERWLVSFADFMTLLFALFVVLFAISQVDAQKMKTVSESLEQAFGITPGSTSVLPNPAAPAAVNVVPPVVSQRELETLRELKIRLDEALKEDQLRESVNIELQTRGLTISLRDAAFFDSGSADLRTAVKAKLERFLAQLEGVPNDMRIEGHTDSVPIYSERYPSNWELSGARAGSMLRFMIERTSVRPRQLSIAGYADQRPIADNSKEEGRQRNRRVDIVILTDSASKDEPLYQRFGQTPGHAPAAGTAGTGSAPSGETER